TLTDLACEPQAALQSAAIVSSPPITSPPEAVQAPALLPSGAPLVCTPSDIADLQPARIAASRSADRALEQPAPDGLPRPEPLSEESPEARIHQLRNSLRIAHEARSKAILPPFLSRLSHILRGSGPGF